MNHRPLQLVSDPPTEIADSALPLLLARLGDEASRLAGHGQDLRAHVAACQAHHLAARVASLPGWPPPGGTEEGSSGPGDLAVSVRHTRAVLRGRPPLPPELHREISRLLELAEVVAA